jgi:hypothetical protein
MVKQPVHETEGGLLINKMFMYISDDKLMRLSILYSAGALVTTVSLQYGDPSRVRFMCDTNLPLRHGILDRYPAILKNQVMQC